MDIFANSVLMHLFHNPGKLTIHFVNSTKIMIPFSHYELHITSETFNIPWGAVSWVDRI